MSRDQPTLPGLEAPVVSADVDYVQKARDTIQALRDAGAIQPWHELACANVIRLTQDILHARGITLSGLYGELRQAMKDLPEPSIQETADVIEYEGDRIRRFVEEYEARDPADLAHTAQPA